MKLTALFKTLKQMTELNAQKYFLRFEDSDGNGKDFDNIKDFKKFLNEEYNSATEILNADYKYNSICVEWLGNDYLYRFDIVTKPLI